MNGWKVGLLIILLLLIAGCQIKSNEINEDKSNEIIEKTDTFNLGEYEEFTVRDLKVGISYVKFNDRYYVKLYRVPVGPNGDFYLNTNPMYFKLAPSDGTEVSTLNRIDYNKFPGWNLRISYNIQNNTAIVNQTYRFNLKSIGEEYIYSPNKSIVLYNNFILDSEDKPQYGCGDLPNGYWEGRVYNYSFINESILKVIVGMSGPCVVTDYFDRAIGPVPTSRMEGNRIILSFKYPEWDAFHGPSREIRLTYVIGPLENGTYELDFYPNHGP